MTVESILQNPGRLLVVLAHPDDEIAIAGWVSRQRGPVAMAWMHSTPVREQESRRAVERIHPSAELIFWQGTDGRILEETSDLQPKLEQLVAEFGPETVATLAYEQGHLDHDATHRMVRSVWAGPVVEFPMYHPYTRRIQTLNEFSDPSGQVLVPLSEAESQLKRDLYRLYPSQTLRRNILAYQLLRRLQFRPVELDRREVFRLAQPYDWTRPNGPEWLVREVSQSPQWARWRRAVQA